MFSAREIVFSASMASGRNSSGVCRQTPRSVASVIAQEARVAVSSGLLDENRACSDSTWLWMVAASNGANDPPGSFVPRQGRLRPMLDHEGPTRRKVMEDSGPLWGLASLREHLVARRRDDGRGPPPPVVRSILPYADPHGDNAKMVGGRAGQLGSSTIALTSPPKIGQVRPGPLEISTESTVLITSRWQSHHPNRRTTVPLPDIDRKFHLDARISRRHGALADTGLKRADAGTVRDRWMWEARRAIGVVRPLKAKKPKFCPQ